MTIKLSKIIKIDNLQDYKAHFAIWNGHVEPLDEFVADKDDWKGWQQYRPKGNPFNRKYIFSFMRFWPRGDDYWLFGGLWEVVKRYKSGYSVKLVDLGKEFIGRLLVRYRMSQRTKRSNFENHYDKISVSEIFDQEYSGEDFPGSRNIDIFFLKLKHIFDIDKSDWKGVLNYTDGIYLITDIKTGKKYVGSAYGGQGIWSRWKSYIRCAHGGNKDLKKLINAKGMKYAENNFKFSLLETYKFGTSDDTIDAREKYWKDVLMSRDKRFGYNDN